MKKVLSIAITIALLLTALSCIAVAADTSVSVSEGFYLKPVPEASDDFTLVYDLCCNDSLGISTVGLTLDYSENLQLESCEQVYGEGMFISSQYIDAKPYLIMWAGGTVELPVGEEIAIARLVFKAVKTLGKGIYLDLGYDPDNLPSDLDGIYYEEDDIPTPGMTEYTYKELRVEFPNLPKVAYAPPVNITEQGFYLKPVPEASSKDGVLVYDLYLKDPANNGVSSFGLMLSYSDEIALVSCDFTYGKGSFVTSEHIEDNPYLIMWVAGTFSLGSEETAIARLTFNVVGDIEAGYSLGLEFDPENKPADINGNYFYDKAVPVMGVLEFSFGDIGRQFPFFVRTPGDVNDDGKVNLTDVSAVLKYIAKWDVELNLDAANVNGDEKVNLADVSLMLKKIAKWDVELQ